MGRGAGHHARRVGRSNGVRHALFRRGRASAASGHELRIFARADRRICLHHRGAGRLAQGDEPLPLPHCRGGEHHHHVPHALHDPPGRPGLRVALAPLRTLVQTHRCRPRGHRTCHGHVGHSRLLPAGTPADELRRRVRESHCAANARLRRAHFRHRRAEFLRPAARAAQSAHPLGGQCGDGPAHAVVCVSVCAPGRDAQAQFVLGARAAYPLLGAPAGGHLDGRAFAAGRLHPLLHHRISFALRLVLSSGGGPLAAAFHPALAAHQVPKHPHRAAFPSKSQSARNGLSAKHAGQLCGSAGRPRYAPGTAHAADFHPLGGANAAIARPREALRCARGGRVARRPAHQHPRRLHPPVSGRRVGGDRRRLLLGKLRRANAECDRCSPRRRPCRSQLAPFAPARLASLAVGGHHRGRERHSRHLRLHAHRF